MLTIEKTGYFYKVAKDGMFISSLYTSASQAGLHIERIAGKEAHREAAELFLAETAV